MIRVIAVIFALLGFLVVCVTGILLGGQVPLSTILLRGLLAATGFLVLGWGLGMVGARLIAEMFQPEAILAVEEPKVPSTEVPAGAESEPGEA